MQLCVCVLGEQRPHLEHLLYVVLVFSIDNAVHVPLEHFDQVPGEQAHSISNHFWLLSVDLVDEAMQY